MDGLPLFGGAQLAVDTTLVSSLHCDGSPHRGAADVDGAVLVVARRRKERTYPELVRPGRRAQVGGDGRRCCWAMVRGGSELHQTSGKSPGSQRTDHSEEASRTSLANEMVLFACVCAARAFAASLLERRGVFLVIRPNPTLHFAPFLSTHFFPCLNPIFKNGLFLSVVALGSVTLLDSNPRSSTEKRSNLATTTIELPECQERRGANNLVRRPATLSQEHWLMPTFGVSAALSVEGPKVGV